MLQAGAATQAVHLHCKCYASALQVWPLQSLQGLLRSGCLVHGCRPSANQDNGQDRWRTEAEGGDEELPTDLLAKLRRPPVPPCSCEAAADSSPSALLLCSPGDVDTLQQKCKLDHQQLDHCPLVRQPDA